MDLRRHERVTGSVTRCMTRALWQWSARTLPPSAPRRRALWTTSSTTGRPTTTEASCRCGEGLRGCVEYTWGGPCFCEDDEWGACCACFAADTPPHTARRRHEWHLLLHVHAQQQLYQSRSEGYHCGHLARRNKRRPWTDEWAPVTCEVETTRAASRWEHLSREDADAHVLIPPSAHVRRSVPPPRGRAPFHSLSQRNSMLKEASKARVAQRALAVGGAVGEGP